MNWGKGYSLNLLLVFLSGTNVVRWDSISWKGAIGAPHVRNGLKEFAVWVMRCDYHTGIMIKCNFLPDMARFRVHSVRMSYFPLESNFAVALIKHGIFVPEQMLCNGSAFWLSMFDIEYQNSIPYNAAMRGKYNSGKEGREQRWFGIVLLERAIPWLNFFFFSGLNMSDVFDCGWERFLNVFSKHWYVGRTSVPH